MGTRSRIGRIKSDGSITSIYTHWDGYPSHHLPILTQHYGSTVQIDALLALGNLSMLAPQIGEQHDFESRERTDWCTAYCRDRNEEDCSSITSRNEVVFAAACSDWDADYAYLWDGCQWMPSRVVDKPLPHIVPISPASANA